MSFPITINYRRRLKATITAENKEQILTYIEKSILEDKADNVLANDMSVVYKGSTSIWRASLYGNIDNGVFILSYRSNSWWLNYQINMRSLFAFTVPVSIFIGLIAYVGNGDWWVGIIMFLWLCGANWIINIIRHGGVANDIAAEIDDLICGKPEPIEFDKMNGKLKSWF